MFITFIGYFYIFGAVILLLSIGTKQEIGIAIRFGLPYIHEIIVRLVVAFFSFILAYGYLKMKVWGYWLTIIYTITFLIISFRLTIEFNSQPFIGNGIWSLIVLIYTVKRRRMFTG